MATEHRGAALRHLHTVLNAGALGSLTDRALLERFLAGHGDADSSAAFAALLERHGPMVMRVCRDPGKVTRRRGRLAGDLSGPGPRRPIDPRG